MSKPYQSCAQWPDGTVWGGVTHDSHDTAEQALGVCKMLERDGFGGNKEVFPVKVWAEGPGGTVELVQSRPPIGPLPLSDIGPEFVGRLQTMDGWRPMEVGEPILPGDELWSNEYKRFAPTSAWEIAPGACVNNPYSHWRRRVPMTQSDAQAALIALDPDRSWTVEYSMMYRPSFGPVNHQRFYGFSQPGFDGSVCQMFEGESWEQVVESATKAHREWTENKALDEQHADVDRTQSLDRQFGLVR